MSGDRVVAYAQRADINREFAGGLHAIGMQWDLGFGGDAGNFFDGLDRAELVVRVHDADQGRLGLERAADGVGIDEALAVDGNDGDVGKLVGGGEDGGVFYGRGDHVTGCIAMEARAGGENREVVGFSAAAGEDDLLGLGRAEKGRDLGARLVQEPASLLAVVMQAGGVAIDFAQHGKHGFHDLGRHWGGGVVIEVIALHALQV